VRVCVVAAVDGSLIMPVCTRKYCDVDRGYNNRLKYLFFQCLLNNILRNTIRSNSNPD